MSDDSALFEKIKVDYLSWRRERQANSAQIADLQSKNDDLDRKIAAAEVLFPMLPAFKQISYGDEGPAEVSTWRGLVLYALSKEGAGITQARILDLGKATALADRVRRSPNGLYVAMKKLEASGEVVRDGARFFLREVWEAIQRGEIEDRHVPDEGPQGVVIDLLADGKARTPGQIAEALKANPRTSAQATKNVNYSYNLLRRMLAHEKIKKLSDGRYASAEKENEPPAELPLGGSDASGVAAPPFENVVGFPRPR